MKYLILLGFLCALVRLNAQTNVWQPSPGHTQILIWPDAPPNAGTQPVKGPEELKKITTPEGVKWTAALNVTRPTMTVYSPRETNTGVAVVVLPGGGYTSLAMDLE